MLICFLAGESSMANRYLVLKVALLLRVGALAIAQSNKGAVTITEPSTFALSRLYVYADKVAMVKVVAGTTEAYDVTIYKGEVMRGFKGVSAGQVVYFGPYTRTEIGGEYILFLKDQAEPMQPKSNASGYGTVRYSKVFDEGYSSMLTSYECVFEGPSPSQHCDYAVRVCTDYILLPKALPTSPPEGTDTPFGCRWVNRERFISELDQLASPKP